MGDRKRLSQDVCALKVRKGESEVTGVVPADRHRQFSIISSSKLRVHGYLSMYAMPSLYRYEWRKPKVAGGIMRILGEGKNHRKTIHWKRNSPLGNNPIHLCT